MDPKKFSVFIKQLRLESKLSQESLAEQLYVSRTTITKWETGVSIPDPDKYQILCQTFNITIEELISSERKNKNNDEEIQGNLLKYINKLYKKIKLLIKYSL